MQTPRKLINYIVIPLFLLYFSCHISMAKSLLPDLEIDDHEDSEAILDYFFKNISTKWSKGFIDKSIIENNREILDLRSEVQLKVAEAYKRLKELDHLNQSHSKYVPYYSAFYFNQVNDLRDSFRKVQKSLNIYRSAYEENYNQMQSNLAMVEDLKFKNSEFYWIKRWISRNIKPTIKASLINIHQIDEMLKKTKELDDEIEVVFEREEKDIKDRYKKYFTHRFDFFGNPESYYTSYQIKRISSNFKEWYHHLNSLLDVVLPDHHLFVALGKYLIGYLSIFLVFILFLYKKINIKLKKYFIIYFTLGLGIFSAISTYILPATNDIIMFTLSALLLTFSLISFSWKVNFLEKQHLKIFNPFIPSILAIAVIDLLFTLLMPARSILLIIILSAIFIITYLLLFLLRFKIPILEKTFGIYLPIAGFLASAIFAWLGFLYPSVLILTSIILLSIVIYIGLALTKLQTDFIALREGQKLTSSFILTLLIPILWLSLIFSMVCWIAHIFNAMYLLELIYTSDLIPSAKICISLELLFKLFIIALIIKFSLNWVKQMISIVSTSNKKVDSGAIHSGYLIFQYLIWSIFFIYALNLLNIDWNNIRIVLGGLSVGFGFALKNLLENFVCGLILLMGKEVRPGDIVEFDNNIGTVEKINIRATFIKTFDNAIITLPNSSIVSKGFKNWTLNGHIRRQTLDVGVAYGSDISKVTEIMVKAANCCDAVLKVRNPQVLFKNFGDSSLLFQLRIWIHIDNVVTAPSQIRQSIDEMFKQEGIEIAFPQLDIHLTDQQNSSLPITK